MIHYVVVFRAARLAEHKHDQIDRIDDIIDSVNVAFRRADNRYHYTSRKGKLFVPSRIRFKIEPRSSKGM